MTLKSDAKFEEKRHEWHEEFWIFSQEHSKVSKFELWWDLFVRSRKCMCLKVTVELCVITMKSDTQIEEELTCCFKIDMKSFTNFDPSARTPKKFVFELALCDQSIYFLSYKSTEELSFITIKRYANFEKKLTCGWKKDMRNLANLHQST